MHVGCMLPPLFRLSGAMHALSLRFRLGSFRPIVLRSRHQKHMHLPLRLKVSHLLSSVCCIRALSLPLHWNEDRPLLACQLRRTGGKSITACTANETTCLTDAHCPPRNRTEDRKSLCSVNSDSRSALPPCSLLELQSSPATLHGREYCGSDARRVQSR